MSEERLLNVIPGCPEEDGGTKELIEKFVSIALPIKITPKVEVKPIKTESCGRPIIIPSKHNKCENGKDSCSCEFTVIQKMKVEIPVEFKLKTDVKEPFVDCEFRREENPHESID